MSTGADGVRFPTRHERVTRRVNECHHTTERGALVSPRVVKRQTGSVSASKKKPLDDTYIPDLDAYETYMGRDIHGASDMDILNFAMANNRNVLLSGPTGAGKTRVGEAFAAMRGLPYYSVPCDVSIDPSALFGKIVPTDVAGKFEWQDGPVTKLVRSGGVLNLSEVNAMSPKIAMALFPLLDNRRQVTLLAHKGERIEPKPGELLIIADCNPGYRGTQLMNAAFLNRFSIKLDWDYDDKVEARLVESASLRMVASKLRAMAGTEIRTPVSTNSLMEFLEIAVQFGVPFAVANFVAGFEPMEKEAVAKVIDLSTREIGTDVARIKMRNSVDDDMDEVEEFDDEEDEDGHVWLVDETSEDNEPFFG